MGGKVHLNVVEAGPEDGPLVVLLHGFPEFWWAWRNIIDPLADAGYCVAVPDQRGYNLSDKPAGTEAYGLDRLAEDVLRIADERRRATFSLVGHDWGGSVAWRVAATSPQRVDRLVVINAPHPSAARRYLRRHPSQMAKSAYILFFQLRWLPEQLLAARRFRLLKRGLLTARPGTFTKPDISRYRAAWAKPGALTAMLNWYRAAVRSPVEWPSGPIKSPTLLVWGVRDPFLEPGLCEESRKHCAEGRILWIDEATHWVHHEEAEQVTAAILGHLA